MSLYKQARSAAVLAALGVGHTLAMAQVVTVTYGPDVASVPTLSEWGMIVTAVLLAVVAVIAMRKNAGSKVVMSLALAAAGLVGAAQGYKFIDDASADAGPGFLSPTGGTVAGLSLGSGIYTIENFTNVPQRVLSVEPEFVRNRVATTCKPGVIVAPGATCDVDTGDGG